MRPSIASPCMGLGKNLGALMRDRGLSYGDVARGIDIADPQTIHVLVKRKSKKSAYAIKLAQFLNVPLDRLLAEDFDVRDYPKDERRREELRLTPDEAETIRTLRGALPEWRTFVADLAKVIQHDQQRMMLQIFGRLSLPDVEDAPKDERKKHQLRRGRMNDVGQSTKTVKQAKNT